MNYINIIDLDHNIINFYLSLLYISQLVAAEYVKVLGLFTSRLCIIYVIFDAPVQSICKAN